MSTEAVVEEVSQVDQAINWAVGQLSKQDLAIAMMAEEYLPLKVEGPDDKEGCKSVTEAKKKVARLRIAVEKRRKELKADSLRYGKAVDAEAKRVTALIAPIETHLITQEKIVTDEVARIKKMQAEAAEREFQSRVDALNELGASIELKAIREMSEEDFDWHIMKVRKDKREEREQRERVDAELAELRAKVAKQEAGNPPEPAVEGGGNLNGLLDVRQPRPVVIQVPGSTVELQPLPQPKSVDHAECLAAAMEAAAHQYLLSHSLLKWKQVVANSLASMVDELGGEA